MKTEQEIRVAEEIIGYVARYAGKTGDKESYEVAGNIAMALKWVLGENVGPGIDHLLMFGRQQITRDASKKN